MAGLTLEELQAEEDDTGTKGAGLTLEELQADETVDEVEGENKIHSRMWEGSSWLDASAQFKEWKDKANSDNPEGWSTSLLGGLRYTDPKTGETEGVPVPEQSALDNFKDVFGASYGPTAQAFGLSETDNFGRERGSGDATVSTGSNLLYGIRESIGDAAVLGGALVDKIGETTGLYDTDATEYMEGKVVQTDTSESLVDSLVSDGGPALLAAIIPAKMAYTAATKAPMLIRGLAAEIAASLGAAATIGTEEETLVVGQNAAFKLFDGLDLNDEASSNAIETRINAFAEGLALAGVVQTGAVAGKTVIKGGYNIFLKGLVDGLMRPENTNRFFNGLDKAVFDDLMVRLGDLPVSASPKEIVAKNIEIAEVIRQNKDVIIKMLDTSATDTEITLDTISAYIKGSREGKDMSGLLSFRRGAELTSGDVAGGGKLGTAIGGPSKAVDDALTAQRDELSGVADDAGVTATRIAEDKVLKSSSDTIVDQGQTIVDSANTTLKEVEASLSAKLDEILPTDANDLEFISSVQRLEDASGLSIGSPKEASLEEIKDGIQNAFEAISNEKNARYLAIKGGEVSSDGMIEVLKELQPEQLDIALSGLTNSSELGVLLNSLKSMQRKAAQAVKEAIADGAIDPADADDAIDAMVKGDMSKFLNSQGMTFEKLYTQIRPNTSAAAENAYSSSDPAVKAAGLVLRNFVRYIDNEALDFAAERDDTIKPLAILAKEYFKDNFAPVFRGGGILEDYGNLYQSTIGRTDATDLSAFEEGRAFRQAGYDRDLDDLLVNQLMQGGNPNDMLEVVKLLKTIDPADTSGIMPLGRAEAALDYMVFDVVNKFADTVRMGGMQRADYSGFSSSMQKYARQISKAFPEKADVLNQLIKRLDDAGADQEKLLKLMGEAGEVAKIQKQNVQDTVIGNFIDKQGSKLSFLKGDDTFKATGNPKDAFNAVFTSKQSINDIERLLQVAEDAASESEKKIILDGLKLAYNRHATKVLQNSGTNLQNVKELSVASVENAQTGNTNLYAMARKIYGEDSELTAAFEQVLDLAKVVAKGQRAKPVAGESTTAFNKAAMSTTQTAINIMLGPLTRLGTQARTVVGGAIDKLAPDRRANQILINLLSDPNYFLELAAKFNKVPSDPLMQEMMERYMMLGVIRGSSLQDDESEGGADAQTQAILSTISNQAARFAK